MVIIIDIKIYHLYMWKFTERLRKPNCLFKVIRKDIWSHQSNMVTTFGLEPYFLQVNNKYDCKV